MGRPPYQIHTLRTLTRTPTRRIPIGSLPPKAGLTKDSRQMNTASASNTAEHDTEAILHSASQHDSTCCQNVQDTPFRTRTELLPTRANTGRCFKTRRHLNRTAKFRSTRIPTNTPEPDRSTLALSSIQLHLARLAVSSPAQQNPVTLSSILAR